MDSDIRDGGKAMQIVEPTDSGYNINEENIEKIFGQPDVVETPVAIYSIAGAFRTGKSFMLNFFLRFLWAQEKNKSETWLISQEKELVEGFAWRGGADKHTPGIWVWNKPFFYLTPQHGKVALFLVDTEGAFDHTKDIEEFSIIFGLSTLLGSVQIYNVQNKIQEDNLQHLQLLTDYAKTAKRAPSMSKKIFQTVCKYGNSFLQGFPEADEKQENIEKPFQKMVFLVRDWSDPDHECDFEGGQKYLKNILQTKSKKAKIQSVRKHLNDSFENISCCLMKSPGEKVCERGTKQGSKLNLEDVRKEFLETLDILVRELFSPEKIVVKRMNGNLVTGKDFINFILAYFKIFSSGEMPQLGTMLQTTARAGLLQCVDECKTTYRSDMQKKFEERFQTEEDLQRNHHDLKSAALLKFDQTPKLGDEEFIAKYRKHLEENIEMELKIFQLILQAKLEQIKSEVRDTTNKAVETYKRCLKKRSGGKYVGEERLQEIEQISRIKSNKEFQDETTKMPQEIVNDYKPVFDDLLNHQFLQFRESNDHALELMKNLLDMKTHEATDCYKNSMESKCLGNVMSDKEFEEAHHDAWEKAMQGFDQSEIGKNTHERNEIRNKLINKIKEKRSYFKTTNALGQEKVEKSLKEATNYYTSFMQKRLMNGYVEAAKLLKEHENGEKEARKKIESQMPGVAEKCIPLFQKNIQKKHEEVKMWNEDLKDRVVSEFRKAKIDAFINYKARIDDATQEYMNDEALEILHETQKEKAVGEYDKLDSRDLQETYNSIKQKLEKKIYDHYSLVKLRNRHFKNELEGKGNMILQDNKAAYLIGMKELCDGKYVKPTVLSDAHNRLKHKAHEIFSSNFKKSASDIKEKFVGKFNEGITKLFEQIQTYNENNQYIFFRKIAGFVVGTIEGIGEGFVSGLMLGAGRGKEMLGTLGVVTGAVIAAPCGAVSGLLTGGVRKVISISAGFKPQEEDEDSSFTDSDD